jgi:predicted CXXCH cytochrome family protein
MKTPLFLLSLWALLSVAQAGSIVTTKHNLSVSGRGPVKAVTETQICIFCHTPHNSSREAPLWNRASSGQTYVPYTSTTAKAHPGQPTGESKLCLSCHDGTVALGMVLSRPAGIPLQGGLTTLPAGATRLGTDLADDHPISFTYDTALMAAAGQLNSPATLTGAVRLDSNAQVQCTTCHNAHDDQFGKFLVMNNTASALCTTCHNKTYWSTGSHRTSTKTWNGIGTNPWPHTPNTNVQANACENCHRPHSAGNKPRLLNFAGEEANCYSCHNGNVAAKNVQAEFSKASVHPVALTTGIHDPTEDPLNSTRHVECVDCHNSHASTAQTATAPTASGTLAGVKGVNRAGIVVNPLVNQYELCFRCHADSTNRGSARVPRQFVQTNTRLEFQSANASFHPVLAPGKNPSVPSLIAPWTTASQMYCTDCHNNNQGPGAGGTGPNGPHGSTFPPLLERRLELTDNQTETAAIYALCYKCHSRTSILADQSFSHHDQHIRDLKTACTTCHDPHGVTGATNLINFNPTYVTKSTSRNAGPTFTSNGPGTRRGSCTLTCHGKDHNPFTY